MRRSQASISEESNDWSYLFPMSERLNILTASLSRCLPNSLSSRSGYQNLRRIRDLLLARLLSGQLQLEVA